MKQVKKRRQRKAEYNAEMANFKKHVEENMFRNEKGEKLLMCWKGNELGYATSEEIARGERNWLLLLLSASFVLISALVGLVNWIF